MYEVQVLEIVPATIAHTLFVIDNIYLQDAEEILAHGVSVKYGVEQSFNMSDQVWALTAKEGVVCLWGVQKPKTLIGGASGWLVTTRLIDKYAKPFARMSKDHVVAITDEYGYIEGCADSRHVRAVRFYKWLGFDFMGEVMIGPQKIPFHRIGISRFYR